MAQNLQVQASFEEQGTYRGFCDLQEKRVLSRLRGGLDYSYVLHAVECTAESLVRLLRSVRLVQQKGTR